MKLTAYKITKAKNIPFPTHASSLDEMTRELPQGFYTTFSTLANGTKVFGLHMHLQRLYAPAKEIEVNPSVDESTLRTRIAELAKSNLPNESRIRLILSKQDGVVYAGIQIFESPPEEIYKNGVQVVVSDLTRHSPRVKDTGFISSSSSQRKQISRAVFEILLTKSGQILEGMTSNFYAIKGKTLVTAKHGILPGVTRRVILRLARGQKMSIEYRAPGLNEKFDEAFLTSSSRGVVPIVLIDNKPVGQGRVGHLTNQLSTAYKAYVLAKADLILPKHDHGHVSVCAQ